ncbi:hypothetical protein Pcinc_035569, partial [Petrolisthes cinctipes]
TPLPFSPPHPFHLDISLLPPLSFSPPHTLHLDISLYPTPVFPSSPPPPLHLPIPHSRSPSLLTPSVHHLLYIWTTVNSCNSFPLFARAGLFA